jgi:hypothetical protein
MKFPALVVATLAVTALVGGTAAAQVTMQPIPNPPEKATKSAKHKKSHAKKAETPAPAADDTAAPATPK